MEVRCSNCATEYEFDDVLVSARGTSVKCTNCGHQFRVHPPNASRAAAEKWVVRDAQNRETTFTSLRDLQQAIVKGQLNPQHQLSHGGQAFRALEDIYELQTFFSAARQRPPNRPAPRTLLGVGRDGEPILGRGAQGARSSAPPPRKRSADALAQDRVTPVAGMPAVKTATAQALDGVGEVSAPRPMFESGSRPALQRPSTPVPRGGVVERPPISERAAPPAPAQVPWQHLQGLRSDSDAAEELAVGRGAGSRWIVAIVVLGALGLIGGTVGRDYFLGFIRPKPAVPQVDQRVPVLLEQARLALAKGDFDSAHAELAKASVLGESDPRVVASLARLEVSRAELLWSQQRLNAALDAAKTAAAEKAPPRRKRTEAEQAGDALAASKDAAEKKLLDETFRERLVRAKSAVAEAVKRSPTSIEVVRAQVDALRLDGQLPQARTLVGALSAEASDPDNAYSLGALDLAEGPSGYPSAIDRLRVAARAEDALGRARPLLIYALAETGDAAAAGAELDKLSTLAPTHRSLPTLRALVDFAKSQVAAPEPEPVAVRRPAPAPASAPRAPSASGEDLQSTLAKASSLHREGDLAGAERLYQGVINRNPNSIPALSGLGDIARQRQSNATAAGYYDQILKLDRNHVPTLMARGDMYWHSGNHILAVALYRRALAQVSPSDPLGQRAMQRIEEFDKEARAASSTDSTDTSEGSAAEPSGDPPAAEEPARGRAEPSDDSEPSGAGGSSSSPQAAPKSPPYKPIAPSRDTPAPVEPGGAEGTTDEPSDDPAAPP